ncbi:pyridoxal phosphate-dependent transferase [Mycena rosella]|uniref:Ornithine aminotransferase n=1 Tax=Mycena rosella TaxID=1033263 RepID=A0AAD7GBN8_MYCRO|nr:pyridoxal phosphate-dependent transferase [Mycena rosella]
MSPTAIAPPTSPTNGAATRNGNGKLVKAKNGNGAPHLTSADPTAPTETLPVDIASWTGGARGSAEHETAVKLAHKWAYLKKGVPTGQALVLSVEGNFHGRTLGVISMSTDPESRAGFEPFLAGVGPTFVDGGAVRTIRFNKVGDLERALELHGANVAAFLVEPIQGEAGIVVPDEGYLTKVHALCKKHNVLLICDEIQTHDGVRPDVVLLGKALSSGVYPVSAVLADREVMLCIQPGEHGSTYGGNPLACAVALTALRVLTDEQLAPRAAALGALFRRALRDLRAPLVRAVRGRGLLNALVFDAAKSTRGRSAWQLCLLLKSRGVLAKPDVVRFAPPLVIAEEDRGAHYRGVSC